MKTKPSFSSRPFRLASIAVLASAVTVGVSAADRSTESSTGSNAGRSGAQARQGTGSDSAGKTVKVTRASTYLGTDVTANDGRKVGDIVDYFFDASQTPHLQYVVVMTGGFMGYGGDSRAVPAQAITTEGDSARLKINSEEYWDVAVLPQNRSRFINDQRNTDRLAEAFKLSDQRSSSSAQSQAGRSSSSSDNRQRLVSFTELTNEDVYDRDGQRLGRFEDTWLSLDANRAPYVEISSSPASPFEVLPRQRYAIPLRQLQARSSDINGLQFDIAADDLRESDLISETEGVQMLQSGEIGKQILRVRVAQQ